MAKVYADLFNPYKFKYQLTFLTKFNKYEEDGDITNQIELPFTLSITQNFTHSEIDNSNLQWALEYRKQSLIIFKGLIQ